MANYYAVETETNIGTQAKPKALLLTVKAGAPRPEGKIDLTLATSNGVPKKFTNNDGKETVLYSTRCNNVFAYITKAEYTKLKAKGRVHRFNVLPEEIPSYNPQASHIDF